MPANRTLGTTASEYTELSDDRWVGETIQPLGVGSSPVSDIATCALDPERESVRIARSFTTKTLRDWGSTEFCDEVELVVSELVTNALRAVERGLRSRERFIHLELVQQGRHVMCLVTDPCDEAPARTELVSAPELVADTGWGLHLVHAFCHRWGWTPLRGGGKVTWALFALERSPD